MKRPACVIAIALLLAAFVLSGCNCPLCKKICGKGETTPAEAPSTEVKTK